jgi:phenylalanine-4-hydroxylase
MYEAIRLLSIVKEAEDTPQATIEAEKQWKICKIIWVNYLKWRKSEILHWWTGIWFDRNKPKIYGAGLLSSIGESAHCMTEK